MCSYGVRVLEETYCYCDLLRGYWGINVEDFACISVLILFWMIQVVP